MLGGCVVYTASSMVYRRLHKQEMLEIRQQLKTASVSNKGGEKESDRLKKELDKSRSGIIFCKLSSTLSHSCHARPYFCSDLYVLWKHCVLLCYV